MAELHRETNSWDLTRNKVRSGRAVQLPDIDAQAKRMYIDTVLPRAKHKLDEDADKIDIDSLPEIHTFVARLLQVGTTDP